MKIVKTLTVATLLTALPGLALAMGCNYGDHQKQAQSCISGTTWDADSQTCVPATSS